MTTEAQPKPDARAKLLDAAVTVIRQRGFSATSVDDLCRTAGVTKGGFFHHFASKEALGVAAAHHWSEMTGAMFATAAYHELPDPLERVLAYIDLRIELLAGAVSEVTCLVGTMVQEAYGSSSDIRSACQASIYGHAATLEADIAAAMTERCIGSDWTAQSLALHTQAVLQGAFILAKAQGDASVAVETTRHLRRYIRLLFQTPKET